MIVEESVHASGIGRAERLTQRQLLLWLGQKRRPDLPAYNMVIAFEIAGELDVPRFRRAFAEVVRTSDALRSVFEEIDGIARRRVTSADGFELPFSDLSSAPDPEFEYRERTESSSAQSFDLGRRCFDSRLFKLGDGRFVWWFCQHHIIGDGASIGLLYRYVSARYADAKLPALGSIAEVEAQESAYLRSTRALDDERFWSQRRKRAIERDPFYAQPAQERARCLERLELALDRAQSDRLRQLAQDYGVPAFLDLGVSTWLKTALFAYLYRVTGRSEQALGVPFRNRHSPRARSAIGCFIEVLPIQIEIAPADSFVALFQRVQEDFTAVLRHGQACIANSEAQPLFDASLNFLAERYPPFAGLPTHVCFTTGLHAYPLPASEPPGGESLAVHCHDYRGSSCYTLWFDFHAARFDADQRRRAITHFSKLLAALLADPETRLDAVQIVSDAERRRLVNELNPSPSAAGEDATVVSLFEARARVCKSHPALVFHGEALSYGELSERSTRVACALRRAGVKRDVLVGVLLERSPAMLAVLLGILKAGGAYVPIDPAHPEARNALVLEDAAPGLVVTQRALVDRVRSPWNKRACLVEALLAREPEDASILEPPEPDALAYVLFTSGSSGRPKGVAIPHSALTNFLLGMLEKPGLTARDRVLALTTITFDIAALELYLPLVVGACIELADGATAGDPVLLSRLLAERRPTLMQATPATFRMLLNAGWTGDAGLRALSGGEALAPDLAQKLASRVRELWNLYGPTETTVWSSIERIDARAPAPITIGQPIRNTTIYILNAAGALAPIGVPGEICIGGAGVARGYLNNTELTDRRFVPDPFADRPGARLYRTGDLGRRRADGRLECLGRTDFQVKIRGFRIELGEIESALSAFPGVLAAAATAREERDEKRLAAYLVLAPGVELEVAELRRFLQQRLPAYMIPQTFTRLTALPLTPNGKVDRRALPKPELAPQLADDPPASDLELRVAALFEQLLGLPSVGRNDDFFELGGHSLLAAELLVKLNTIAKRPLGIGQIFQRPTVAALAQLVQAEGTSDEALVIPLNRASSGAALFCVCGIHLYRELAQNLPSHPVYGVYLPAEEQGLEAARSQGKLAFSVEELAKGYVSAIRKQQPKGPYRLAGVSFGGVLAYEIAQQLQAAGEQVALVALFDATLPRALQRRWARWLGAHLRTAIQMRSLDYVVSRVKRSVWDLYARAAQPASAADSPHLAFRVRVYLEATRRYDRVVRPYPGKVVLYRASARDDFAGYDVDPSLGWGDLVPALVIHQAAGTHLGILFEPGVRKLASSLGKTLATLEADHPAETRARSEALV
jgi:amino acid adenylation domain-containing protein